MPPAEGEGLLGGPGEHGQGAGVLPAGGGRAGPGGGVEQALEGGRVLGAVGAEAELAGDVDTGDDGDGLDPVVTSGGEGVAAGGADAQQPDAAGVDVVAGTEIRDGGLEVLHAPAGVLQAARQAAGLALVRGVEGEGDEAALRHPPRVRAGGLFLHARAGVADHERGPWTRRRYVGGVEVTDERDAGAVEGDAGLGHEELPETVTAVRCGDTRTGGRGGPRGRTLPGVSPLSLRSRPGGRARFLPGKELPPHTCVLAATARGHWRA